MGRSSHGGAAGGAMVEGARGVLGEGEVRARGEGVGAVAARGGGSGPGAREARSLFTALAFLTRLPAPAWVDHHPEFLMRGLAYFPLLGALVGGFVGAFFDAACTFGFAPRLAGTMGQLASLWVTGCFHEDGLADSCDGIGGGWSRSQILRIMSDTRLGTYGCAVLILFFSLKVELLASLGPSRWALGSSTGASPALLVAGCMARWTAPYLVYTLDYAEENGPKSAFYGAMVRAKRFVTLGRLTFATASAAGMIGMVYGEWSTVVWCLLLSAAVWLLAAGAGIYAQYLLGGVVGDYLGATVCVAEVVILAMVLMKDSICDTIASLLHNASNVGGLQWVWKEGFAVCTPSQRWSSDAACFVVLDSPKSYALLRFLVICTCCFLWCRLIGRPDVFVVDAGMQKEGTSSPGDGVATDPIESPAHGCAAICTDPASSFNDRYDALRTCIDGLAMPVGALGTLEDWAARLGALQRTPCPKADRVACLVFAGDHGVAKSPEQGGEGCSAYPADITAAILRALQGGHGAGGTVLASENAVSLRVFDVGVSNVAATASSLFKLPGGTANFCRGPAMTAEECEKLIRSGRSALRQCMSDYAPDAVILGEIGIGNTTCASTLLAAITGEAPESVVDGGARVAREVHQDAITKKIGIVKSALKRVSIRSGTRKFKEKTSRRASGNVEETKTRTKSIKFLAGTPAWPTRIPPTALLAEFGGAEVAAIVGAILEANELNLPVIVDGFISSTSALVAALIAPHASRLFFLSTRSPAAGHACAVTSLQRIAKASGLPPLPDPALDMRLRLGEGTGGCLAAGVLRSAAAMLREMSTLQAFLRPD